jgi:MFS family permease
VLRLPGALRFSLTGFLARMPISMFGLGTVLLIAAVTGRYGVAGVVAAVGSVGYAVAAPQFGKLTDRFGQRRVLLPQVAVFAFGTGALMVLAEARAPLAGVAAAGAVAGASMPSIGPMVRARWSALLADPQQLHTAFSLESVVDEVIFVVGPVLVTLLATAVYPAAGLGAALVLCASGTVLFAAQRRTEPRPGAAHGRQADGEQAEGKQAAAGERPGRERGGRERPGRERGGRERPGRERGGTERAGLRQGGSRQRAGRERAPAALVTLVPVYLLLGAMFSAIELSTVAFASEQGHKPVAGVVLGVYALGSAVGGLWYGSRHWRAPLPRRFTVTLGCMAAGVATFWFQPGLATLFAAIFVAGLAIAPTLINGYSLIEYHAAPGRRTEGMTWLSSAISVGVATGSALAGRLIDAAGARWGYVLSAALGGAAFMVCLAGIGRLRRAPVTPAGPPG